MKNFEYININKQLIPYNFTINLGAAMFKLHIRYNDTYDFFTIDLYRDDELLVAGEKVVYGVPLFETNYDARTHPPVTIIPKDPAGIEQTVNWRNLNETVFLIIQNGGESA